MKKVLIIDDSLLSRSFLEEVLAEFDVEIFTAENGAIGLELYQEHRPDLVTSDITMPEMDGITTLKRILKINPNAKVIMISAMGQQETVVKCLDLGAKGFISKPFKKEEIIKKLKKFLS